MSRTADSCNGYATSTLSSVGGSERSRIRVISLGLANLSMLAYEASFGGANPQLLSAAVNLCSGSQCFDKWHIFANVAKF